MTSQNLLQSEPGNNNNGNNNQGDGLDEEGNLRLKVSTLQKLVYTSAASEAKSKRKAIGQINFLKSLGKDRISRADIDDPAVQTNINAGGGLALKSGFLTMPESGHARNNNSVDGEDLLKEDTKSKSNDNIKKSDVSKATKEKQSEYLAEVLEVSALHHQYIPKPERNNDILIKRSIEKRYAHEAEIKEFESKVRDVHDDIETKVLAASRNIRDNLEKCDEDISNTLSVLQDETYLVKISLDGIGAVWKDVEKLFAARSQAVEDLADQLKNLEKERADTIGTAARKLVDRLVVIGHLNVNEIERLAESYALELNMVIVTNRKTQEELMALLRRNDVIEVDKNQKLLEERKYAWRRLRHFQAIDRFQQDIESQEHVTPADREQILKDSGENQVKRNAIRISILEKLKEQEHPNTNQDTIDEIDQELEKLHEDEENALSMLMANLENCQNAAKSRAEQRREELRATLHDYQALKAKPCWENEIIVPLRKLMAKPSIAGIISSSGDLKFEIEDLIKKINSSEIIYDEMISDVFDHYNRLKGVIVDITLQSNEVDFDDESAEKADTIENESEKDDNEENDGEKDSQELQDQTNEERKDSGKDGEEKVDTVEEAVKIVEEKAETVNEKESIKLNGLSVYQAFLAIREEMSKLIEELKIATKAEGPPILEKMEIYLQQLASIKSLPSNIKTTVNDLLKLFLSAVDITISKSSRKGTPDGEREVKKRSNLKIVSSIMKRVSFLFISSDIMSIDKEKENIISLLKSIEDCLIQQRECNTLVNKVIEEETAIPLKKRWEEQSALKEKVESALQRHIIFLHTCGKRITTFYSKVAQRILQHKENITELDTRSTTIIKLHLDEFEANNTIMEEKLRHCLDRVRMAANKDELQMSMEKVIVVLQEVEDSYRQYHQKGCELANIHPRDTQKETESYIDSLCQFFGLIGPELTSNSPPEEENEIIETPVVDNKSDEILPSEEQEDDDTENEADDEDKQVEKTNDHEESLETMTLPMIKDNAIVYKVKENPNRLATKFLENVPEPEERLTDEEILHKKEIKSRKRNARRQIKSLIAENIANDSHINPLTAIQDALKAKIASSESEDTSDSLEFTWWKPTFAPLSDDELTKLSEPQASEEDPDVMINPDPLLLEVYTEIKNKSFRKLSDVVFNALKNLAMEDEDVKEILKEYTSIRKMSNEFIKAQKVAQLKQEYRHKKELEEKLATPRNLSGIKVVEKPIIPIDIVSNLLGRLRDSLLTNAEHLGQARKEWSENVRDDRVADYTDQLEERLRMHWPRKGRAETLCKQPREFELQSHDQKILRHVRAFMAKEASIGIQFEAFFSKVEAKLLIYKNEIPTYIDPLKECSSIAALQAIDTKVRKRTAVAKDKWQDDYVNLMSYVEHEPTKLLNTNRELLRTCVLFEEGGDYDPAEIKLLQEALEKPSNTTKSNAIKRKEMIENLKAVAEAGWDEVVTFKEAFENATLELCLREGLGQKYGAPRRGAQETIRTEITRSNEEETRLAEAIAELESLCSAAPNVIREHMTLKAASINRLSVSATSDVTSLDTHSKSNISSESGESSELSKIYGKGVDPKYMKNIREQLLYLRQYMVKRGNYLEVLKEPESIKASNPIPLDLEGGDMEVEAADVTRGTFRGNMSRMEETCKQSTIDLYISDGKEEALGEDGGIPDSLKAWLNEKQESLFGDNGFRNEALDKFISMTIQLANVLGRVETSTERTDNVLFSTAPSSTISTALLEALVDSAIRASQKTQSAEEKRFKKIISELAQQKVEHKKELRPYLGSPDCAEQLEELVNREKDRILNVKKSIVNHLNRQRSKEATNLKSFIARLNALCKATSNLLDTFVYPEDLTKDKEQETDTELKATKPGKGAPVKPTKNGTGEVDLYPDWKRNEGKWDRFQEEAIALTPAIEELKYLLLKKSKENEAPVDGAGDLSESNDVGMPQTFSQEEIEYTESKDLVDEATIQIWDEETKTGSVLFSFKTDAHDALMKLRNEAVMTYTDMSIASIKVLEAKYRRLLQEERKWESQWQSMVDTLLASGRQFA